MGPIDGKLIAAGLVAFLVGSGVAAFGPAGLGPGAAYQAGCASLDEDWDPVDIERDEGAVQTSGDQAHRLIRWHVPELDIERGVASLCVDVGSIEVDAADVDTVSLSATIGARGEGAADLVRDLNVEADVVQQGTAVGIAFGQAEEGPTVTSLHDANHAVRLLLEVPEGTSWAVEADASVGEVELDDLRVTGLDVALGTGELDADRVVTLGDVDATVDTGEIDLELGPESSGEYRLDVGTGEIDVSVPRDPEIGYDVTGETGAGDVDLQIGPTEERSSSGEGGSSDRAHARSQGYDARSVQVAMQLTASIGDIDVTAE